MVLFPIHYPATRKLTVGPLWIKAVLTLWREQGITDHITGLLESFYANSISVIRWHEDKDKTNIGKGERQRDTFFRIIKHHISSLSITLIFALNFINLQLVLPSGPFSTHSYFQNETFFKSLNCLFQDFFTLSTLMALFCKFVQQFLRTICFRALTTCRNMFM